VEKNLSGKARGYTIKSRIWLKIGGVGKEERKAASVNFQRIQGREGGSSGNCLWPETKITEWLEVRLQVL